MNHFILKIILTNYCSLFEINIKNKTNRMYGIYSFLHIIYLFRLRPFHYLPIYHLEFSKNKIAINASHVYFISYFNRFP